ncbi:MAG TPA: sodium:proton exchanger, partial [Mycobacteriales bacterium]|nr:sodium:proton exchanger [Mycobacteriales bacterium]
MSLTRSTAPAPTGTPTFSRSDLVVFAASVLGVALSAVTRYAGVGEVVAFVVSGATIGVLASLVGRCVDQLGDRFGPGATGVLQSALGNLPELFIGIFALRAGLTQVVQAAIIGSILGNALLVLGLAFLVGGLRHGTQRFSSSLARNTCALLILAVAALVVPSLASYVHTPASRHEDALSVIVSVVLLVVFVASIPSSIRGTFGPSHLGEVAETGWPLRASIVVLALAGLGAAL